MAPKSTGGRHDRLHRRLGPYAVRPPRGRDGRKPDRRVAASEALADAGIAAADVDEIVLGHFNAGFSPQDFTASLVLQASPDLRFKRATRVENACATGSAAVHQGLQGDRGQGRAHRARGRRRADDDDAGGGDRRATCSRPPMCARRPTSTAALPAYSARSPASISSNRATSPTRSRAIAAKNHSNGVGNPYAQIRKDLGYEFCRTESEKNRYVAGPLKRTDCSLVSDGAAAVVLADVATALKLGKARRIPRRRARAGFPADVEARRPQVRRLRRGVEARARRAPAWRSSDLSFVETHDCFTIAELIEYEAMGLVAGRAGRARDRSRA